MFSILRCPVSFHIVWSTLIPYQTRHFQPLPLPSTDIVVLILVALETGTGLFATAIRARNYQPSMYSDTLLRQSKLF